MSRGRGRAGLRPLAAPFVVAPPSGARTRTRLRLTSAEETAVEQIGVFLGGLYRQALASRIELGVAGHDEHEDWWRVRKQELTAASSSRWAGTIARAASDSFSLGMRGLDAEIASLRKAITVIGARMAVPVGERIPAARPGDKPVRGYATVAERHAKSRRKAGLQDRLDAALDRQAAGHPRIACGGGRLWRHRQHLDQAELTLGQWEQRWRDERMFIAANGETGAKHGNLTIRVSPDGQVSMKVPGALTASLGTERIVLGAPVSPATTHLGGEWADRIAANSAVRYDIHRDRRGRWYLDASWSYPKAPAVPLAALRQQRTLGVDLNDGHVAAAVIDPHGNLVGFPRRLEFDRTGTAEHRDAQLRHLITRLIHLAQSNGCASVSIENLGFDDARATGRETMGRGQRGKRFRRTVAGIATGQFRRRLAGMTATASLSLVAVDPAYTTQWGQHWLPALKTSDPSADGHQAAAVVIGRRSLGHRARRKPPAPGPRTRQRTRAGQPARPAGRGHQASHSRVTTRPRAHDAAGRAEPRNTRRGCQHRSDGRAPGAVP